MSEIFDKRFVYFMWDDALEGKQCFMADDIDSLQAIVERGNERALHQITFNEDKRRPFKIKNSATWRFAYYDPNYEVKKAFSEGKKIQVHCVNGTWVDYDKPFWFDDLEFRVKPEEEKKQYRPYESSAEMIADFIDRFKVNCPPYAEPLVWIKSKETDARYLIDAFREGSVRTNNERLAHSFAQLLEGFVYLDGSPCGMEIKK